MTSSSFFLPGKAPSRAYQRIRDQKTDPAPKARSFIEGLWLRYRGYEDPHFLSDAKTHFLERFWEMYLAVTFMERGLQLSPPRDAGPDILCRHNGQKIWLEAVAPGPGDREDMVAEPELDVPYDVPTEKILLRFTNALAEKRKRYLAAHEKGVIGAQDCYVLAVNSRNIPHAPYGNTLPYFIQAVLPIGDPTIVFNRVTAEVVDSYYEPREAIVKAKGGVVSTKAFLDPQYSFVSAVLHSSVDCVNRPPVLGNDFVVLHNPTAQRQLKRSLFSWCKQYVYNDGELKVLTG